MLNLCHFFRRRTRELGVVSVSLLMSACVAVGPDYQQPALEQPVLVVQDHVKLADYQRRWWANFDDSVLTRLIDITLQNNQSLAAATANVNAAFAVFREADQTDRPQGDVIADYTAQNQLIPGFTEESVTTRTYRFGGQLSWSLDLFGKLQRTSEAALADAQAQYYAWHDLRIALLAQVAQNYAELRGAQARVQVAERNLQSLQKTIDVIRLRTEEGFASELDLRRVEAQLYGVMAIVPPLKAQVTQIENTLMALAGGPQAIADINLQTAAAIPDLEQPLAIGEPAELLRRRADLQAAERRLAAAVATLGARTAELYPDLSVTGFLGFLAGDTSSFGSESEAWTIAPGLSWSIFSLGSVRARIDAADARQQAALASFRQTVLDVVADAQSALAQYGQTQRQRHLLQAQTKASRQALELAQIRYDGGVVDVLDLLDAERSLLQAEDNLVLAETRTFSLMVDVYRAFGGGFEPGEPEAFSAR